MHVTASFNPAVPQPERVKLLDIRENKWFHWDEDGGNAYIIRLNGMFLKCEGGKLAILQPFGEYLSVKEVKGGTLTFNITIP